MSSMCIMDAKKTLSRQRVAGTVFLTFIWLFFLKILLKMTNDLGGLFLCGPVLHADVQLSRGALLYVYRFRTGSVFLKEESL